MAPERNFHEPIIEPEKEPKARSAQRTKPPFPGRAVASSAVIRASGMLQTKGKRTKPRMARRGPPAWTVCSEPKGPPETSK
ncbi:hypothetical protein IEQ34_004341 [Dendrobium chrysotoxum]|uniref:Uncharacterized protein n=1 Tax=Dendrobium chrysotoxum TaxID=161865 RepID=A0AAV7HGX5_DENCH|nr:hypothetical protein IEQ34_003908 [Dendrobium chrysotoxum]KAH0467103.1 hypothetical protein IEQ34_004341 [Dendrobium chrysotoxum]